VNFTVYPRFLAPVNNRERNSSVQLTLTELVQFIEGSASIGKSPALLTWADLTPRWPEAKKPPEE